MPKGHIFVLKLLVPKSEPLKIQKHIIMRAIYDQTTISVAAAADHPARAIKNVNAYINATRTAPHRLFSSAPQRHVWVMLMLMTMYNTSSRSGAF